MDARTGNICRVYVSKRGYIFGGTLGGMKITKLQVQARVDGVTLDVRTYDLDYSPVTATGAVNDPRCLSESLVRRKELESLYPDAKIWIVSEGNPNWVHGAD